MEVKDFVDALDQHLAEVGGTDRRAALRVIARRLGAEGRAVVAGGIGLEAGGATARAGGAAPAGGPPDLPTLLERARALLARVEAGEYGFDFEHDQYGDYWDDEGELVDEDGLGPEVGALLEEAVYAIERGDRARGLAVIDLLADMDVPCEYDGADFFSLLDRGALGLGRDEVLAPWMAAAVRALEGEERLERVFEIARRSYWQPPLRAALELADLGSDAADRFLAGLAGRIMAEIDQAGAASRYGYGHSYGPAPLDRLLAEAASLRGRSALREAADRHGRSHPVLHARLVEELSGSGDLEAAVSAAAAALAAVPESRRSERARIADLMFQAAEEAGRSDQAAVAAEASFAAGLDLPRYLRLRRVGGPAAVARGVAALKGAPPRGADAMAVLFLAGEFKALWDAVKGDKAALGWSRSDKGAAFPLILSLLFGQAEPGRVAGGLVRAVAERHGADVADEFMRAVGATDRQAPPADLAAYREWCRAEVLGRVEAVVRNQHRGAYDRAAALAVAHAETMAAAVGGGRAAARAYVAQFHERYPRHSAFRRELDAALARSSVR
ncbi:MAG: hypothetical protein LBG60_08075 [Bifidobacteriaceae bacterium]|nr:hypothetical protein [Bifidobacteriaceae bacterium]